MPDSRESFKISTVRLESRNPKTVAFGRLLECKLGRVATAFRSQLIRRPSELNAVQEDLNCGVLQAKWNS
jgi:hypothetical protein